MTTDANFVGGGDNANPNQLNGKSPEQTVEQTPSAVKPTLPVGVFTFDELVVFDSLSDTNKKVVADLISSASYRPSQLSRALLHISQTPGADAESLIAILTSDSDEDHISPQPLNIEGSREHEAEPITIELPFFLCWQVRDQQHATNLYSAIETIFWAFSRSEIGKQLNKDVDQMMAYKALQFSIEEIVEKAAIRRLGSFTKPRTEFPYSTPSLAMGDPSMDYAPALNADPTQCTEVDALYEWIDTLQRMARLQQSMNTTNVELRAIQKEVNEGQKVIIDALTVQVKSLELSIESARRVAIRDEEDRQVPSADHYISPALYLTGGYESEIEAVREALAEASNVKLQKLLKHVSLDETEEAFFIHEEYTRLQNVLARITTELAEVAINNHSRFEYTRRPQYHLSTQMEMSNDQMSRKEAFVEAYSLATESYSEDSGEGGAPRAVTTQEPKELDQVEDK